jgi:hypothetical protein
MGRMENQARLPLILLFQQLDNSLTKGEVGLAGLRRVLREQGGCQLGCIYEGSKDPSLGLLPVKAGIELLY